MLPSGWTVSIPGEDYDVMGSIIPSSPSNHHEITRSRDENWLTMRDINFSHRFDVLANPSAGRPPAV
jgi:hypothetical protein